MAMKKWRSLLPLLVPIMLIVTGTWGLKFILVNFFKFEENEGAYLIAGVLACVLTVVVEFSIIQLEEQRRQKATRKAMQYLTAKGAKVESRVHPVTYIDTEPKYYEEAADPSYTLSYRFPQASAWALHKTRSGEGNLPNGWKLIVSKGEVPPRIRAILETIAKEKTWSKAYLELGSDQENVWAFWGDGYDGLPIAQKVFEILTQIVEASEN
jgi:hypothetical protein